MPRVDVVAQCEILPALPLRRRRIAGSAMGACAYDVCHKTVFVVEEKGMLPLGQATCVQCNPRSNCWQAGGARSTSAFPKRWQHSSVPSVGKSTLPVPCARKFDDKARRVRLFASRAIKTRNVSNHVSMRHLPAYRHSRRRAAMAFSAVWPGSAK